MELRNVGRTISAADEADSSRLRESTSLKHGEARPQGKMALDRGDSDRPAPPAGTWYVQELVINGAPVGAASHGHIFEQKTQDVRQHSELTASWPVNYSAPAGIAGSNPDSGLLLRPHSTKLHAGGPGSERRPGMVLPHQSLVYSSWIWKLVCPTHASLMSRCAQRWNCDFWL